MARGKGAVRDSGPKTHTGQPTLGPPTSLAVCFAFAERVAGLRNVTQRQLPVLDSSTLIAIGYRNLDGDSVGGRNDSQFPATTRSALCGAKKLRSPQASASF